MLLETFDEADIARATELVRHYASVASLLVGVNCRDLVSLEVVPGRLEALVRALPDTVPRVAESGVATAADAGRIAIAGYDVALVGSALMESLEPHQLVRAMVSAGRTERARDHEYIGGRQCASLESFDRERHEPIHGGSGRAVHGADGPDQRIQAMRTACCPWGCA